MLGDLLNTTWLYGITDDESILRRAETLGRKAVALDPGCQAARFTLALCHFTRFERTSFLEEAEQALQLNPNNANYLAAIAVHMVMVGKYERAMTIMDRATALNPHHPGWYHVVPFMNAFPRGDYSHALKAARLFNTQGFLWDPLIRTAALGLLGRKAEAKEAAEELLNLVPEFTRRGESLIRRVAFLDEHVDMLVGGQRRAGLHLESVVRQK
jgi:tetratricopeptide (TPR) repeat protein